MKFKVHSISSKSQVWEETALEFYKKRLHEHELIFLNHKHKLSSKNSEELIQAESGMLLNKVEKSVIWLLENNESSKNNLIREAKIRGVNREKLVYAKRTSHEKYLSQFKYADLYLDTFIYGAGATASNALWMGVPLLTMAGRSYSARMATSLLHSVGLKELITSSKKDYEALAIKLSTDSKQLNVIKEKLIENVNYVQVGN